MNDKNLHNWEERIEIELEAGQKVGQKKMMERPELAHAERPVSQLRNI